MRRGLPSARIDDVGQTENVALLADVFDAIGAADVDRLRDYYTDDYILELPYSPTGPAVVSGRDAALDYVAAALTQVRFTLAMREMHPSADADLIIAEYDSEGTMLASGAPYRNAYIGLWWFRDGRVCKTREFYNPLATTAAG